MPAAPPPVATAAEWAQPKPNAADTIRALFRQVRKEFAQRAGAPTPKKSRRKDTQGGAFIRKHTIRLFRKIARQSGEDWRDPPPAFDSDWWHQHQQRAAVSDQEHGRELAPGRPDYPSPTL